MAIWPANDPEDKAFYASYAFCNIFAVLVMMASIGAQFYVNKCPYANQNFARFRDHSMVEPDAPPPAFGVDLENKDEEGKDKDREDKDFFFGGGSDEGDNDARSRGGNMDFGFADTDSMMLVREQVNINEETIMSCGEWFKDSITTIKATKGLIPMIWFNFVVQFSQYPGMVEATFFDFLEGKPN